MAAVMQKAAYIDDQQINQENEYISKLTRENEGLRELLQISKQFGSFKDFPVSEDKSVQTEEKSS